MYLAAYPVRRVTRRRSLRGLGDGQCTNDPGLIVAGWDPCPPGTVPGSVPAPPPAAGSGKPAPPMPAPVQSNKSVTDWLMEAWTGHPAQSAIYQNTTQCIQNVNYQRQLAISQGTLTPDLDAKITAAAKACGTDQQAYVKLIGGTAQQNLSILPVLQPETKNLFIYGAIGLVALGGLYLVFKRSN